MDRVREWQPGDPAMLRLDAETEIRVTRSPYDDWVGASAAHYDPSLSVRPLVVIDPEDEDLPIAHALWERLVDLGTSDFRVWRHHIREVLNGLANPTPPIEEPTGWGAVVEDDTGAYWTLYAPEAGVWINYREGKRRGHEINVARVLSEGVPAEAKS